MCVVCIVAQLPEADTLMLPKFYWVYFHARVNVHTEREGEGERKGERERERVHKTRAWYRIIPDQETEMGKLDEKERLWRNHRHSDS